MIRWTALALGVSAIVSGQSRGMFEVRLPPGLDSQAVSIRYLLAGESLGGWVQPRAGVSSCWIETRYSGQSSTRIKGLIYAPGCQIETFDLRLSIVGGGAYPFACRPLNNLTITGRIDRADRLYNHVVKLDARYVARWAQAFFGSSDIPVIPLSGTADVDAERKFRFTVPDFAYDQLTGTADLPGEIQIRAVDAKTGDVVATLIPEEPEGMRTRMGGLKILPAYPAEIAFTPCAVIRSQPHTAEGFALRPDASDACDR